MSNQVYTHVRSCCRSVARLHVDGVSVLLAQRFVLLGVERLPLQVYVADLQVQKANCL